jgi:hypothetical protein
VKFPSSPPPPRVPRSRRDDRFVRGHPMPPKRAGIGIVVSTQYDTVTVLVDDEELVGVIPLYAMPGVGAIVEIEARDDLLVIPVMLETSVFPALADWYFGEDASPSWQEEDADDPAGEHVYNTSPTGSAILWNTTVFSVTPDDKLTFTMNVDQLPGSAPATVRMVFNWAAVNVDPQPGNGEVAAYGPTVTIDGDNVPFSASVTVPDTFTKPNGKELTTGSARLGLRYTPGGA